MNFFTQKIVPKTDTEIENIKLSCIVVSKALSRIAEILKPGVTGKYLDSEAETLIQDLGAKPAFKGYNSFPNTLCISINNEVVHGIPSNKEFREGDVVSVDCGAVLNGYFGDSAFTFALGEVNDETVRLLESTYTALYKGIEKAIVGNRIGDISFEIQQYAEKENGYGVVRELVGHGIGTKLHEPPDVPNFGMRGKGIKLFKNLVIAIEPMINMGMKYVKLLDDQWTIVTKDNSISAHFEHTIAVKQNKAEILTDHSYLLEEIKKNKNIMEIPINI